ncbi:hypothetical protein L218DRAFT_1008394 [Marasmius fiardii PR-910]|nr:hypothetical protein L218DRAFT_1008394 [Marasmius fiardii PR-910]
MHPSSPTPEDLDQIITGYAYLLINKYYILASTVMLCYDHILTFDDEIKYIWRKERCFPFWLFVTFRYASPIVSIINLVALHEPNWVGDACKNWIWLPVAIGSIISLATGIIMILRVHAIYSQATWVLLLTLPVYIGQLIVLGVRRHRLATPQRLHVTKILKWAVPAGVPANLPPGFVGCIPVPKRGTGIRLSSGYIAALIFDATIFALTLGRAIYYRLAGSAIPLMTLVFRDGTLYFAIIFVVNLTNLFLIALAPPDLRMLNAAFTSMISTILVARYASSALNLVKPLLNDISAHPGSIQRLMLNLRAVAEAQMHSCTSRTGGGTRPHVTFTSNFGAVSRSETTTSAFLSRIGADDFAVALPDTIFGSSESEENGLDDVHEEYQMFSRSN